MSAMSDERSNLSSPAADFRPVKHKRSTDELFINSENTKKRRRKRLKITIDPDFNSEHGINSVLGRLDRNLLADHLTWKTKQFEDNLTALELEEKRIPAQALHDTSDWNQLRILSNLPEFLEHYASQMDGSKSLSLASKKKGTPHTIVITGAGLRAADITRSLRTFETKDAKVAKLFAKHIKLKEAIECAKKTRIGIGVGTPERLMALLEAGAISSDRLERIVVDFSHIDQKRRGILDMRETQEPLIRLLSRAEFKARYGLKNKGLDLLFF